MSNYERRQRISIFVGTDCYRSWFVRMLEAHGWVTGKKSADLRIRQAMTSVDNTTDLTVRGHDGKFCIPFLVSQGLSKGATVNANLRDIHSSHGKTPREVARLLAQGLLDLGVLQSPNLHVRPTRLWNEAVTEVLRKK